MNVLFYADPTRLYDAFLPSVRVLRDHLLRFCGQALLDSGEADVRAVVSEVAGWQADGDGGIGGIRYVGMPFRDMLGIFPSGRSLDAIQLQFFRGEMDDACLGRLADWLARHLGAWTPDVVIAYPTQCAPFQRIYPHALCLTMENGIFSREPFPRTLRFEPVDFMNGFLNRYRDRIWSFPVGEAEREAVRRLCDRTREILSGMLDGLGPLADAFRRARERFRHLVLCPVPYANFYGEAEWDDQILWLSDILERLPRDIGVVVTFHDNLTSQLNARTLAFLRARHPNLVPFGPFNPPMPSAALFPFVDAILNCETMTGTQGMLVCPRIVSLDKSYSAWMADSTGLDGLVEALERPAPDRTAMICWYLTHYAVYERRFGDAGWYLQYFRGKLERFRREGLTFEMFERTEDIGEVAAYVIGELEKRCTLFLHDRKARRLPHRKAVKRLGRWMVKTGSRLMD